MAKYYYQKISGVNSLLNNSITLTQKDFNPILDFKKNEFKFLAPSVFKFKEKFAMLYCNRGTKQNIFQGNLSLATSNNLTKWKRDYFFFKQPKKQNYQSFTKSTIFKDKTNFFLFVESSNNQKSDIVSYSSKNLKIWKKNKKLLSGNRKNKFQSPFLFKKGNYFLFFAKNGEQIEFVELSKKFKIKKRVVCFKKDLPFEKFSIYAPFVLKYKKYYIMFYSAWSSKFKGNISVSYSTNLINWTKSRRYLFKIPNSYKIISEPFIFQKGKKAYFFFEFKKKNFWNIGFKKLNQNFFRTLITANTNHSR